MQKNNRTKIKLLFLFMVCGLATFAQKNTSSPYSRYGVGNIVTQGKGRSVAMGGAGIALNSKLMLNSLNPASYAALDSMSFLYEIGLKSDFSKYSASNATGSHYENKVNFDYFNIAWPVTQWWRMGLGLFPKSNVGYEFVLKDKGFNGVENTQEFIGKGGVNRFNFTHAIIPFQNLYIGVNASYIFGEIENDKRVYINNIGSMSYYEDEKMTVKDVLFDFGLQYTAKISKNEQLTLGAIFNAKSSIRTDRELIKKTVQSSTIQNILSGDTTKTSFDYPMTWGVGLAYHYKDKITVSADYTESLWSESDFLGVNEGFNDEKTYAMGMEYTPDRGSLRNYYKTMTYRFGGYYKETYLPVQLGKRINDYGITFGVGIPMRRTATNINVGFEIGQKGTLSNNLVKENYAKICVSFSMFSRWFYKQKYE